MKDQTKKKRRKRTKEKKILFFCSSERIAVLDNLRPSLPCLVIPLGSSLGIFQVRKVSVAQDSSCVKRLDCRKIYLVILD
jgi:hypothetical protein